MDQAYEFGAYRLDAKARSLWRGSEAVSVPPKALRLLQALIERRGEVVSKRELLARVWPDTAVDEANLSVTVALLRKTIDPQADGSSHIQTLARRGYRFVAALRGEGIRLRRHEPATEADAAYSRGRGFWARLDLEGITKALRCFEEAVNADPDFAAAHAALSIARIVSAFGEGHSLRRAWELAGNHAEHAMGLDPRLPEAHVARSGVALFRDWDWKCARACLDRACNLAPGAAEPLLWRALLHTFRGNATEARSDVERHEELDPGSSLGGAVATLGRLACQSAPDVRAARSAVDRGPERFLGHWMLALTELARGRAEDACHSMRRAVALTNDGPAMRAFLAHALAVADKADEARAVLDSLGETGPATLRARVLVALGETAEAWVPLEKATERREPWLVFLDLDGAWEPLRRAPRFAALRERVLG